MGRSQEVVRILKGSPDGDLSELYGRSRTPTSVSTGCRMAVQSRVVI